MLYPESAYPRGNQRSTDTSQEPVGLTYLRKGLPLRLMQRGGHRIGERNIARIQSQVGRTVVDAVGREYPELRDPDKDPLYVVVHGAGRTFFAGRHVRTTPRDLADTIRTAHTPDGRRVWTGGQPIVLHSYYAGCVPAFDGVAPPRAEELSRHLGGTAVYGPDGTLHFSDTDEFLGVKRNDVFQPGFGFRRFGE